MEDPRSSSGDGWTFGKVLGFLVGLIGMVGFGFCSLCGLVMGVTERNMLSTVLIFSIPGLGLAVLGFLLMRTMLRRARKPRNPAS